MLPPDQIARKLQLSLPSPIMPFTPEWQGAEHLEISVKRDDLIHPIISGNKWRKLKYALAALPDNCRQIISFGGGYSNHLHACGYVCDQLGLTFIAIVRGDYSANPTPMLKDLSAWGGQIQYVDKSTYRLREDAGFLTNLQRRYPAARIIPEGGSQEAALKGVQEIFGESSLDFDYVCLPVASGGTLAGALGALQKNQAAIGIAMLKGQHYLEKEIHALAPDDASTKNWRILHQFHHGGYAKTSPELSQFCTQMNSVYKLPVEPVYSGKLFFAIRALIADGFFPRNSRILVLHTGGLQGNRI